MIIGEVVEVLINLKDQSEGLTSREYQAVIEACNVLDRLPRMEEAMSYEPFKN